MARTHHAEQIIETILEGSRPQKAGPESIYTLAQKLAEYDCRGVRVVVLGGGTGLSTVVGGNPQLPDWPDNPFIGLKQLFPLLQVVVCSTDDGLSTGLLLKQLPLIGIGGITCLRDVLEFLLAGATAIQVGTANFTDPTVAEGIVDDLERYCDEHGVTPAQLVGQVEVA